MSKINKLAKDLAKIIKSSEDKKTSPYDTPATVTRLDGTTAWVHIPGGVDETPVKLTVNASVGDTVQVRVAGGRAWITGNATAPPTDDSTANFAVSNAQVAYAMAGEAQASAAEAHDAAESAVQSANIAREAAESAEESAIEANLHATGALNGLSTVEKVVDVLNWIATHGEYQATSDDTVQEKKMYFIRSGSGTSADPYIYTPVDNPTGNPSAQGWYELTGVDEAVTNYVSTHLALLDDGLYVTLDNTGYKVKITNTGVYIINNTGQVISTYSATTDIGHTGANHVHIDNDSVDIMNGNTLLASFGEGTRIGKANDAGVTITTAGVEMTDENGDPTIEILSGGTSPVPISLSPILTESPIIINLSKTPTWSENLVVGMQFMHTEESEDDDGQPIEITTEENIALTFSTESSRPTASIEGTGITASGTYSSRTITINYTLDELVDTLTDVAVRYYYIPSGTTAINMIASPVTLVFRNSETNAQSYIKAFDGGIYGNEVVINPGGNIYLGGGEYAPNRQKITEESTSENTYIGADGKIYLETNGQTIEARKTWEIDTSGDLIAGANRQGVWAKDRENHTYPYIRDNGTNLWIGAHQTQSKHHTGGTVISSGHNGTNGNPTIYIAVPNASNNNATGYGVYHTGNLLNATASRGGLMSSSDKAKLDTAVVRYGSATSSRVGQTSSNHVVAIANGSDYGEIGLCANGTRLQLWDYGNSTAIWNLPIDKITKLSFGSGMVTANMGDSTTEQTWLWGNSTNKVGVGIQNTQENKRYNILAKATHLELYNTTDTSTLWKLYPVSGTAPISVSNGVVSISNATTSASGAMTSGDKTKVNKLVFGSAMTNLNIGDGANCSQVWIYGNDTNKVAIGAFNETEKKRYTIYAKDDRLGLYNNTDGSTVYDIYPVSSTDKENLDKIATASYLQAIHFGSGTQTRELWFFGDDTNKVAISALNNMDTERYTLTARETYLRLLNNTTGTTVWDLYPTTGSAPVSVTNGVVSVSNASQTSRGLMTAADKKKLDEIDTYQAGATFTAPVGPYSGYISSSSTEMVIFVPLPKGAQGRTVTIPKTACIIRGGNGYVDDSYNTTTVGSSSAYTWTINGYSTGLRIVIKKSSAYTSVTNNTPISVQFRSNLELSFS